MADSNIPAQTTTDWPGAFGVYRTAKRVTGVNINSIIVLYLLSVAVSIILSVTLGRHLQWLEQVLSFLVGVLVTSGITACYLKALDGTKVDTNQAVSIGAKHYVDMFFTVLLMYVASAVSLLVFIIPFFFVFPRVLLAPYFLIDKGVGPMQALRDSWEATKGNVGKVYGIIGVTLLYCLLFITIIGIPFAIYFLVMYSSASAVLYRQLIGRAVAYDHKPNAERR